jgi:predicted naringenin-chalcone synthase
MQAYAREAPRLALAAIGRLGDLGTISHLVVASCTGFVAPGVDQIIARELGLPGSVERTLVGFMGCYAAVAALRLAHHLVRSEPEARVLVVTVELSSLHLQPTADLEALLAQLQFGDGAAAAIVTAEETGLALDRFVAATLPDSADLIRWDIGDEGFIMHLAGAVPNRIAEALADPDTRHALIGDRPIDGWAVHAGGRSVLDAVERSIGLPHDALADSRAVLAANGNMSSATLMFVLERIMAGPRVENGLAIAFGPGLAAEGFGFRSAA